MAYEEHRDGVASLKEARPKLQKAASGSFSALEGFVGWRIRSEDECKTPWKETHSPLWSKQNAR